MAKETTREKAKRGNLILFIVMLLIGIVAIVLDLVVFSSTIVLIIGIVFVVGAIYIFFSTNTAIKRSFCPKCNTKYNYNEDIEWEEVNEIETESKVVGTVEFVCHCPNCHEEQTFTKKFTLSYYNEKKGEWKDNNLETLTRKYFIK